MPTPLTYRELLPGGTFADVGSAGFPFDEGLGTCFPAWPVLPGLCRVRQGASPRADMPIPSPTRKAPVGHAPLTSISCDRLLTSLLPGPRSLCGDSTGGLGHRLKGPTSSGVAMGLGPRVSPATDFDTQALVTLNPWTPHLRGGGGGLCIGGKATGTARCTPSPDPPPPCVCLDIRTQEHTGGSSRAVLHKPGHHRCGTCR